MKVLETDRLILRRQTVEDAAFLLELWNDPSWIHNIGDTGVRTVEDALEKLGLQFEKLIPYPGGDELVRLYCADVS